MAVPRNTENFIDGEQAKSLLLAHPDALAEYERLEHRERLINQIIAARISRGWSQGDLPSLPGSRETSSIW